MENKFDIIMSKHSDFILYEILHHKRNGYNAEAIISAENEFSKRNIEPAKLLEFENTIQSQKNNKIQKQQKTAELVAKLIHFGKQIIPTQKGSISKNLKSLSLFLLAVYSIHVVSNFSFLVAILLHPSNWNLSTLIYTFPFLLYPIAIYGFWKIKKYGWYLTVSLVTYSLVNIVFSGIAAYHFYTNVYQETNMFLILTQPNISGLLVSFIVLFGLVLYLNKKKTVSFYGISQVTGAALILILFSTLLMSFVYTSFY